MQLSDMKAASAAMQFANLGHAHMCPLLSEITGLCVLSVSPWSVPLAETENWMGSSLPQLWAANETKPRSIAVALNISTTSWCNGNIFILWWRLLQGYLQYQGQCFFQDCCFKDGCFYYSLHSSYTQRPEWQTRISPYQVLYKYGGEKRILCCRLGFLRHGYEIFSLLL